MQKAVFLASLSFLMAASQHLSYYDKSVAFQEEITQKLQDQTQKEEIQQFRMDRELQTACPSITFSESYQSTYSLQTFSIVPKMLLTCTSKIYTITGVTIADGGVPALMQAPLANLWTAFTYTSSLASNIKVTNWAQLGNNVYYNVSVSFQLSLNGTQVPSLSQSFFLVIGSVNIQYLPFGTQNFNYNQNITIDYSQAFDPIQPLSGKLTSSWSCGPLFVGCVGLKLIQNQLNPVDLINNNAIIFNQTYQLNITITNPNSLYLKSVTDQISFLVNAPEATGPIISCLYLTVQTAMPLNISNRNLNQVIFNNNNYSNVVYTGSIQSLSNCVSIYGSSVAAIAFTQFNNTMLIPDSHSFSFNTTAITIPKANIQQSLTIASRQNLTSYAYLYYTATKQVIGYQYMQFQLKLGDQTLYAMIPVSFIQVDSNKLLYIDGSSSYDLTNPQANITFIWTLDILPNQVFPNTPILVLTPAQRILYGINQQGAYYNFTLKVQQGTRVSIQNKVLVQVSPGQDPQYCVQVLLKNISLSMIMTYTSLPLLLQARVIKNTTCTNIIMESLIWSCPDVFWQFWQTIGNNNTVGMDRTDLQTLPKSININMMVQQYYLVGAIEYVAVLNFVLFVQSESLVVNVTYPSVFNPRILNSLILDGSNSYDPQAVVTNTTNVPVQCTWVCPSGFIQICSTAVTTNGGCTLSINSQSILTNSNYNFSISGQMFLFKIIITKDTRLTTGYFYVTIIDNANFPQCNIQIISPIQNSINMNQLLNAQCKNTPSSASTGFTYLWTLYQWNTLSFIPEAQQLITTNQVLRLPPYLLSAYSQLFIQLMVTANNIYSTPIGLQFMNNDQSNFVIGQLGLNFNSFTSYLSYLIMTPIGWDSALSSLITFQYRIQQSPNSYRLLLSPQQSTSVTPISSILPPFVYEQAIYIDVIDVAGNYVTVRKPMISQTDVLMTATQFAILVNTIIQSITYSFSEVQLELDTYNLRQYFNAYMTGKIDLQGFPASFFLILGQNTILYQYNAFVLDQRLKQVTSNDRTCLISQHIIEIIHAITKMHRNTISTDQTFQALTLVTQLVTSGKYIVGNQIGEISSKLYQIAFQTADYNTTTQASLQGTLFIYSQVLLQVLHSLQSYLYPGEVVILNLPGDVITYNSTNFVFQATQLTNNENSLLSLTSFIYDPNEVYGLIGGNPAGGMMLLMRNSTFAYVEMYDQYLNVQPITLQQTAVTITFIMSYDVLQSYVAGNVQLMCASRRNFAQAWSSSTIKMGAINNVTGTVLCYATHFTQYTLIIRQLTPVPIVPTNQTYVDPTTLKNQSTPIVVVSGKWNNSILNVTNSTLLPLVIFEVQPMLMYLVSLGTLVIFISCHFFFKLKYKGENSEHVAKDLKHIYTHDSNKSRTRNICKLYGLILLNFNPYLNIFNVYNKFLSRWVRNLMLQTYFMMISIAFGINQVLYSLNVACWTFQELQLLIALFFLVVCLILILRPLALKLLYALLYEPHSRVEDYRSSTSEEIVKPQVVDFNVERVVDIDISEEESSHHNSQVKKQNESEIMINQSRNISQGPQISTRQLQQTNFMRESVEYENNKKSFLPSIFELQKPTSMFQEPSFTQQISGFSSLNLRQQNIKAMANVFDEIDIEKDNGDRNIIVEEGQLNRSGDERDPQNKNENVDNYSWNKPIGKVEVQKKKKKVVKKKQVNDTQLPPINSSRIPPQEDFGIQEQPGPPQPSSDKLPDINSHLRSSLNRKSFDGVHFQFYQNQEDASSDHKGDSQLDDEFNQQLEGGEIEEEIKVNEMREIPLDRGDDELEISRPRMTAHSSETPTTDMLQNQFYHMNSNEQRFIDIKQPPQFKKKFDSDIVIEHSIDYGNSDNNTQLKTMYVNKLIGKSLLVLVWAGLLVANMLCLTRMYDTSFSQWAILSVAAFFVMVLVIDSLLYLTLACLMLKSEHNQTFKEKGNDSYVEYFTGQNNKQGGQSRRCASLFVLVFIGREKMKDLKRRINPHNPL